MSNKNKPDSVFKEAWNNMSSDFNNLIPKQIHPAGDKKKFVLWLFVLELIGLGVASWFGYSWWIK